MRYSIRLIAILLLFATLLLAGPVQAETIEPGAVRWATGTLSSVDVAYRAVLVTVPITWVKSKELTVGVTMDSAAKFVGAKSLADLKTGTSVTLKYTRKNGMLVGTELWVRNQ